MSLVGFFLIGGMAYAGDTDIQQGEAASDKAIQATEKAPASASDEKIAAPKAYSEPEKEEAGLASEDIEKNAPAKKEAAVPDSPEKAPSTE